MPERYCTLGVAQSFLTAVLVGWLLSVVATATADRENRDGEPRSPRWMVWGGGALVFGMVFSLLDPQHALVERDITLVAAALMLAVADGYIRIAPNVLTLPGIAAGLAIWALRNQPAKALLGAALAVPVFLPGVILHQIGSGDLKAAAALGAIAGWPLAAYGIMAGVLLGGIVAALLVLIGLFRRTSLQYLRRLNIPYVIPLSAGFVLAAIFMS